MAVVINTKASVSLAVEAHAFVAEAPAVIPFVIDPLLTKGGSMLVFGSAGVRKSWLAQGILADASAGRDVLGFRVPSPVRSLYVTTELSEAVLRFRTAKVLAAKPVPGGMMWCAREGVENVHRAGGWERLEALISESDAELVCIDPLLDAVGGRVLDYEVMTQFFQKLRGLDKTLIIVHHSRKSLVTDWGPVNMGQEEATGVIVAAAKADTIMQLKGGKRPTLTVEKHRHGSDEAFGEPLRLVWDAQACVWGVGSDDEELAALVAVLPPEGTDVATLAQVLKQSKRTVGRLVERAAEAKLVGVTPGRGSKPTLVKPR